MDKIYGEYVMGNIRERMGLERNDTSKDDIVMKMSRRKVINEVLAWEGICGWTNTIFSLIENVYDIELE